MPAVSEAQQQIHGKVTGGNAHDCFQLAAMNVETH
jgi:hypothetical protein